MEHVKALLIKAIMTFVVLYLVLGFGFGVNIGDVITLTLVIGAVAYLFGDLVIFPKAGNLVATLADLGLAFLLIWTVGSMMSEHDYSLPLAAAISAAVLAAGEWVFHRYLATHVFNEQDEYSADY